MDIEINFFELERQCFELKVFVREVNDDDKRKLTIENSRLVSLGEKKKKNFMKCQLRSTQNLIKR